MRYIVLVCLVAAACRAESPCPYLNAPTAAGVLGGPVTQPNTCLFIHGSSQLWIEVQPISPPFKLHCEPNPAPLKAVGNEAFACSVESKNGAISEQVAGRVRDRAFLVRLRSNDIPPPALREKARLVAEQVAGMLF